MPREIRNEGPGKGGTYVMGTKDKKDLQGGGTEGQWEPEGQRLHLRWADPDGSPYRAELRGGVTSPARITEKDRRRRRPRLPGSGPEPPLVVAILPLRWAEASGPFQSRIGLSRLPPAPSLWSSAAKTGS